MFGGVVKERLERADGGTGHCEVVVGNSLFMLGATADPACVRAAALHVYVDDADAVYARALAAGASAQMAPTLMFYGDRMGALHDPFGNLWWIAQRVETVPAEEIQRRARALGH